MYPAEAFSITKFSMIVFLCCFVSNREKEKCGDIQRDNRYGKGKELAAHFLLVLPKLEEPTLQMQWPDFKGGVGSLEWRGNKDCWWETSEIR